VASMDWPEVATYRGIFSAQPHREEIILDLYKSFQDPQRGLVHEGMLRLEVDMHTAFIAVVECFFFWGLTP
jgi:hypothetical protein